MRKWSIICSCGLNDECVNLFSSTLHSSGISLGCTCVLYYFWISLFLKVHRFLNHSVQYCISTGYFCKIGFQLYGPQRKQHSRKSCTDITGSGPLNITILHWHWQLLHDPQICKTSSKWCLYEEVSENSQKALVKFFLFVLRLFWSIWSIPHVSISTHVKHLDR